MREVSGLLDLAAPGKEATAVSSKRCVRRKAERDCLRKRAYVTHDGASRMCRFMLWRTGEHLDAYRCKVGDHWHIGHAPMRVQVALGRVS